MAVGWAQQQQQPSRATVHRRERANEEPEPAPETEPPPDPTPNAGAGSQPRQLVQETVLTSLTPMPLLAEFLRERGQATATVAAAQQPKVARRGGAPPSAPRAAAMQAAPVAASGDARATVSSATSTLLAKMEMAIGRLEGGRAGLAEKAGLVAMVGECGAALRELSRLGGRAPASGGGGGG